MIRLVDLGLFEGWGWGNDNCRCRIYCKNSVCCFKETSWCLNFAVFHFFRDFYLTFFFFFCHLLSHLLQKAVLQLVNSCNWEQMNNSCSSEVDCLYVSISTVWSALISNFYGVYSTKIGFNFQVNCLPNLVTVKYLEDLKNIPV